MSSFTWLDTNEQQRNQMLDVINLFKDKETRDELGIGVIRDAFADMFFPGTSTIQTRARYFLFIPWVYLNLERTSVPSAKIAQRARWDEVRIIEALYKNGQIDGLIGRIARSKLKTLPSSIYWQGLGAWGIRMFSGSLSHYHRSLDGFYDANKQKWEFRSENKSDDVAYEQHHRLAHNWDPELKKLGEKFDVKDATFDLTYDESNFLKERIVQSQPGTLLSTLITKAKSIPESNYPWEHPLWPDLPPTLQKQLIHAKNFSLVINSASLLYNLMLAEKIYEINRESGEEIIERYRNALQEWREELFEDEEQILEWDWKNEFWETVSLSNPKINPRTRSFVNLWCGLVFENKDYGISDHEIARNLVERRERRLKGKLSRLSNPRSLELWGGAAGIRRLNYRWTVTRRILSDIMAGLYDA